MADPIQKVTAPVGSHFLLRWTTDAYVNATNSFHLIDGTTKEFPGRPPKKGISKGDVKVSLSITKDGKADGFRVNMPKPGVEEKMKLTPAAAIYYHEYTFIFRAKEKAVYQFTVDIPDAKPPQQIIKEVTVVDADPLNDRRQDMLDLINKWLPSSVMGAQTIPPGETTDILDKSGWDQTSPKSWSMPAPIPPGKIETLPMVAPQKWTQSGLAISANGEGQISAAKASFNKFVLPARQAAWDALSDDDKKKFPRPSEIPIVTSCISVMGQFVKLWGNQFTADLNTMKNADPTFYIKAIDEFAKKDPRLPKPGDILYLVKEHNRSWFQHVCILVSRSSEVWVTADGGGGALPDQTAAVVDKPVSFSSGSPPAVPLLASVTDGNNKALHGWVDIDLVPNDKYNQDGSRK